MKRFEIWVGKQSSGLTLGALLVVRRRKWLQQLLGMAPDGSWQTAGLAVQYRATNGLLWAQWELSQPGIYQLVESDRDGTRYLYLAVLGPPWDMFWLSQQEAGEVLAGLPEGDLAALVRGQLEKADDYREVTVHDGLRASREGLCAVAAAATQAAGRG